MTDSTIIYTHTDEAPLLATYSFLPIIAAYAAKAGVDFTIVRLLPETEYRIKAKDEPNERVARESELRPAADPDRGLWPGRRE